jgi:hypothetical protein
MCHWRWHCATGCDMCHWRWHCATGRDMWHCRWHCATGCDAVQLEVTLCHWMWRVQLDVTLCNWRWHCATGWNTVPLDAALWHWMRHCATGCDTVPLDVTCATGCGTVQLVVTLCNWMWHCATGWASPAVSREGSALNHHSSIPRLTFWTTWSKDASTMQQVILSQLAAIWPKSDMAACIGQWKRLALTYAQLVLTSWYTHSPVPHCCIKHFFNSSVVVTIWLSLFQSLIRLLDRLTGNSPSPWLSKFCAYCPAVELPHNHICMLVWGLVLVQTSNHCTRGTNPWHSWVSSKHSAISHSCEECMND